jgi:hypothetical protein
MFISDPDLDFLPIPEPGSRGQKGTGPPDPQHWFLLSLFHEIFIFSNLKEKQNDKLPKRLLVKSNVSLKKLFFVILIATGSGSGKHWIIWRENSWASLIAMSGKVGVELPGVHGPELQGGVRGAGHQQPAVRRPRQLIHRL